MYLQYWGGRDRQNQEPDGLSAHAYSVASKPVKEFVSKALASPHAHEHKPAQTLPPTHTLDSPCLIIVNIHIYMHTQTHKHS